MHDRAAQFGPTRPLAPAAGAPPHARLRPPPTTLTPAELGDLDAELGGARIDLHVHSRASSKPLMTALGWLGCPECYSEPERVYDQAVRRGMDFVTLTDHDSISGALELVERGFEGVVIGEEVTVHFPEDRCKLHVLVWGLSPEQHERIGALGLRDDVYDFARWLRDEALPHSLAHPLYVQNDRLTRWHLERAALLFKGFELLNGAHAGTHRDALEAFLESLTPDRIDALSEAHGIRPLWPDPSRKIATAGSDDHGLLNVGRTWTQVFDPLRPGRRVGETHEAMALLSQGATRVGGEAGRSDLLAHQLMSVAFRHYTETVHEHATPRGQRLGARLSRFTGTKAPEPTPAALAWDALRRKAGGARPDGLPIIDALRETIGPLLERRPELLAAMEPGAPGPALSRHAEMAGFMDDLVFALQKAMAGGAMKALRERDASGVVENVLSYAVTLAVQAPYIVSLFHQNKERQMLERLKHDLARPGKGDSPLGRPMRVALFTDTLGDVNGVCRFIQNIADQANKSGRDLRVITSTTFPTPKWPNIFNFEPVWSTRMPKYEQLEVALPPLVRMLRHVDERPPDVIHISTPGPVGCAGFLAAKMLKVPVLGVYHTDFPAYVDHLFDDHAFTRLTSWFMRAFYRPFASVFTRSQDYVDSLVALGLERERITHLLPGLDIDRFDARRRDPRVWQTLSNSSNSAAEERPAPISPTSVKVLYVGRVSVEKNLPMLTRVWKRVQHEARARGIEIELIVVGDGPYRPTMKSELATSASGAGRAHFLGFRHGDELSAIYASSDFFVFPSTTDTLGQVVMESQASGLPVIVTDQGGPKEVVDHDLTGFVLSADDADAWAARILQLATDHELRRRMGRAANTRMARYSIGASFDHFWKAHEDAWAAHLAANGVTAGSANGAHDAKAHGAPTSTHRPVTEMA